MPSRPATVERSPFAASSNQLVSDNTQIYTRIRPPQLKRAVSFYEDQAARLLGNPTGIRTRVRPPSHVFAMLSHSCGASLTVN
jgi:hypothetical protein